MAGKAEMRVPGNPRSVADLDGRVFSHAVRVSSESLDVGVGLHRLASPRFTTPACAPVHSCWSSLRQSLAASPPRRICRRSTHPSQSPRWSPGRDRWRSPETAAGVSTSMPRTSWRVIKLGLKTLISVALLGAAPSFAAGCLSGAAVGGVGGHYAGHHAIAGAAVGCAVGHHMKVKQERKENAAAQQRAAVASAPNGR